MSHERIKERIRKLLNLGNDPSAFEGEIRNALAFAQKLMNEHQITESDLKDSEILEEMDRIATYTSSRNMAQWESNLLWAIKNAIGTVGYYTEYGLHCVRNELGIVATPARLGRRIQWYGPREDVKVAIEMFHDLSQTVMTMAKLKFGKVYRGPGRSYCEGFTIALGTQVSDQNKRDRNNRGRYLCVRKSQLALKWLKDTHGVRLRSVSSSRGGEWHGDAYREGKTDGANHGMSVKRTAKLGTSRRLPK